MDMSSGEWLANNMGNEDASNIIQHCHMMMMGSNANNMDEFEHLLSTQPIDLFFDETNNDNDFELISSLESKPQINNNNNLIVNNKGVINKELKVENDVNWTSYASSNCSSERIISFGSSNLNDINNNFSKFEEEFVDYESGNLLIKNNNALIKNNNNNNNNNNSRVGSTSSVCTQEHVLAERRRREKMTERFLALSALIPGLTKMDKATILGDAAKYVKQLEEQVRKQEEQITRRNVESFVLINKNQHHLNYNNNNVDNYTTSSSSSSYSKDETNNNKNEMVEIEARICNKNVLIRVHSQKKEEGLVQFVLQEISNLDMTTLNCITMPFGRYALDITIIAEMNNEEKKMTSKEVVKQLGLALQQFTTL